VKYLLLFLLVLLIFGAFLFPRSIPRILGRLGRSTGSLGRAGKELATGEEVEGSPLARYEVRAGEIVEAKLLAEQPLSEDAALQGFVSGIGERLAANAHRKRIPYRFAALESGEPNALAVPGGAVFITRPLVELCGGDPDLVACVLGHEVVHIDRRHAIRNLAASMAVRAGFQVLSLGRGAILSRLAGGMQQLLVSGYRQDQELEADLLGTRLARSAGFDPHGLIALLERVRALRPEGSGPLAEITQYFKSHPPIAVRIENLRREVG
jgi:predicted Zn-dependent protease